jgi:hypothetical protein
VIVALAYALVLPAIAVLHVRHAPLRRSGAILATTTGGAFVAAGAVASIDPGLRPTALLLLGMWWWVMGKMWVETSVVPRALGFATALLGAFAIAAAIVPVAAPGVGALQDMPVWNDAHALVGAWLVALAVVLARRDPDVPSA